MLASRKSERLGGSLGGGSVVAPPSTSSNEDFFGRTIDTRVLIAMVGLPARGKSFVAHKLVNFLNWRCIPAKIFNVGNHRRKQADGVRQDANFFDVNNSDALKMRENLATEVLKDAVDQLLNGSLIVAVFDATNTTRSRRDKIRHFVEQNQSDKRILQLIFIESICNDAEVIAANFDQKIRNSPDYRSMTIDEATADLKKRIANYESVYEPIDEDDLSYVKVINLHSKIIANRIVGSVGHLIVGLLLVLRVSNKGPIFLCRAGEYDGAPSESAVGANAMLALPNVNNAHKKLNAEGIEIGKKLPSLVEKYVKKWEEEEAVTANRKRGTGLSLSTWMSATESSTSSSSSSSFPHASGSSVVSTYRSEPLPLGGGGQRSRGPSSLRVESSSFSFEGECRNDEPSGIVVQTEALSASNSLPLATSASSSIASPTPSSSASTASNSSSSLAPSSFSSLSSPAVHSPQPKYPSTALTVSPLSSSSPNFHFPSSSSSSSSSSGAGSIHSSSSMVPKARDLLVYSSTLERARQTASFFHSRVVERSCLNGLNAGIFGGSTLDRMSLEYPEEYKSFMADPFNYRFPGGESLMDVVVSLELLVLEAEQVLSPVVMVGHKSTLQLLYGYFMKIYGRACLDVPISRHSLIVLWPTAYGWTSHVIDVSTGAIINPMLKISSEASPVATEQQQSTTTTTSALQPESSSLSSPPSTTTPTANSTSDDVKKKD